MTQKDYMLYGTKVLNLKTQEISLLICIWKKNNKRLREKYELPDYQVRDSIDY